MKKRKVCGEYEFRTSLLFPRWMIMCREVMDFMEDEQIRMIRLDHRFVDKYGAKWITSDARVINWDRTEIARTLGALRSEILHLKNNP